MGDCRLEDDKSETKSESHVSPDGGGIPKLPSLATRKRLSFGDWDGKCDLPVLTADLRFDPG